MKKIFNKLEQICDLSVDLELMLDGFITNSEFAPTPKSYGERLSNKQLELDSCIRELKNKVETLVDDSRTYRTFIISDSNDIGIKIEVGKKACEEIKKGNYQKDSEHAKLIAEIEKMLNEDCKPF